MDLDRQRRGTGRTVALVALALLLLAGGWLLLRAPHGEGDEVLDAPLLVQAPKPEPKPAPKAPAVAVSAPGVEPEPPPKYAAGVANAERLFDEACRWVANGEAPVAQVRSITWAWDAKLDLDGTRHEGPMRLWLQLPDLYRQELTMSNSMTTKVMNRDNLYVKDGADPFRHMNRTADGATSIKQVQDDMERLKDLTTVLTLEGLKGPGVTFEYEGEKNPSGSYARPGGGTWAKIVRRAPGRPNIYFWLAHETDDGGVMRASYPGVVRIDGDSVANIPTEDFLLQDWREPLDDATTRRRSPHRMSCFQLRPGQAPLNFLTANVTRVSLNTPIDASRFEPK